MILNVHYEALKEEVLVPAKNTHTIAAAHYGRLIMLVYFSLSPQMVQHALYVSPV